MHIAYMQTILIKTVFNVASILLLGNCTLYTSTSNMFNQYSMEEENHGSFPLDVLHNERKNVLI